MMDYKLHKKTWEAYIKLKENSFYMDEITPFLLMEVREFAVQISKRKVGIWDRYCQVDKNVKQSLPFAKEAGYGEDVLKFHLDRDSEFTEAERIIKLIDEKGKSTIQRPEVSEKIKSDFSVKSIIIAYLYMYKKGIYPIPEIEKVGKKMKLYKKLAEAYQLSYNSFRTDWKPLEEKTKRLTNPENIRLAIKLLKTFDDSNIKEAVDLAESELREAELKS